MPMLWFFILGAFVKDSLSQSHIALALASLCVFILKKRRNSPLLNK